MKIRSILAAGAIAATSISAPAFATPQGQFADVQPTNWAYQAILSLRDKYGCAVGYPDQTFRAGQPATRAELAALANACLDEITSYVDEKDAALAAALRKEIGTVSSRVTALEVAAERKAQGVNSYLGAGVLLNRQGVDGGGYEADRVIAGAVVQARFPVTQFAGNDISLRPYSNFVAGPNSQFGAAGGVLATYDLSLSRRTLSDGSKVSAANLYAGAGYQVPFVNNTDANFQSAVGDRGQAVFAVGLEGRLTNSLVGFVDAKFPTTNAANSYGATDGSYSPVVSAGLGFKF